MIESHLSRLEAAREAIRAQFLERSANFRNHLPVHPWTKIAPVISYVHDLPVEHLQRIRLHVDPLMGRHSGEQFLVVASKDGAEYARDTGYEWLGAGVRPSCGRMIPTSPDFLGCRSEQFTAAG